MDEMSAALEAVKQDWLSLAYKETRQTWRHASSYEREDTYRRTAESLQKQIETGVPHCSCCLKPVGTGATQTWMR